MFSGTNSDERTLLKATDLALPFIFQPFQINCIS